MVCPKCKSESVSRAHRSARYEWMISSLGLYPFRCGKCSGRFYRFDSDSWDRKRPSGRGRGFILYAAGFCLFLAFLYYITRQ